MGKCCQQNTCTGQNKAKVKKRSFTETNCKRKVNFKDPKPENIFEMSFNNN